MTMPNAQQLYEVIDATWPAARKEALGPFILREGQGGGSRASATTVSRPVSAKELPEVEAAMDALGQPRLFMIGEGDGALDTLLEAQGYVIKDPVTLYAAPVARLAENRPPRVTALLAWEPLALMKDIWAEGGIGPARLAVMHRAAGPKTGLIGRLNDHPAAAAFCAIHDGIAMVHALEVLPHQRRQGMAGYAMCELAFWAKQNGASHIALAVTKANIGANALYTSLGMTNVGSYHYRLQEEQQS